MSLPNTRMFLQRWGLLTDQQLVQLVKPVHAIFVGAHSTHDGYIIERSGDRSEVKANFVLPSPNAILVSVRSPWEGYLPPGDYYVRPLRPIDDSETSAATATWAGSSLKENPVFESTAATGPFLTTKAMATGHIEFVHKERYGMLPRARPPLNCSFVVPTDDNMDNKAFYVHAAGRTRVELCWKLANTNAGSVVFDAGMTRYNAASKATGWKNLKTIAALTADDNQYEYNSMADYYRLLGTDWGNGSNSVCILLHDV